MRGGGLRHRFRVYLVLSHLAFAAVALVAAWRAPVWMVPLEAMLGLSFVLGWRLVSRVLRRHMLADEALRLVVNQELTSHLSPMGDPEVDGLVAAYNGMVDRLRDERVRVEEQQQFLAQIVRASPSGLLVLDFDGRITELSPAAARLLDVTPGAALGRRLTDLPGPTAAAIRVVPCGRTEVVGLAGGQRVRCHHGTFMDRGFRRGFLVLEELTEALRQCERAAYEKLIRVMSHEVNNTVTVSNSLLESAGRYGDTLSPDDREDFRRAVSTVMGRTAQLGRFMRRFADVFRLPPPVLAPESLSSLIRPLVALVASRRDAAAVQWTIDMPGADLVVAVDRSQFEQALLNILINAVDAAGPGGVVVVRARLDGALVELVVEDSGPGLTGEAAENVFTPFFSTKPQGQGIGLTLVQQILVGHGCAFALDRPTGGPTRFVIRLPVERGASTPADLTSNDTGLDDTMT